MTTKSTRQSDEDNGTASRISRAANMFRSQHSRSTSAAGDVRLSFSSFIRKRSKDELNHHDKLGSVNTLGTDGTLEDPIDEPPIGDGGELTRKRSKKGKGKEKSKASPEKNKGGRGHLSKSKAESDEEKQERECNVM